MVAVKTKKKVKHTEEYTKKGKPITEREFDSMVKESDESGYMTLDEFKKKCRSLLNFK